MIDSRPLRFWGLAHVPFPAIVSVANPQGLWIAKSGSKIRQISPNRDLSLFIRQFFTIWRLNCRFGNTEAAKNQGF